MGLCFFKRRTLPYMIKIDGRMSLKENFFSSHGYSKSCRVVIGFLGNINFNVLNKVQDNNGRIWIFDVQVDDATFLLINLYKAKFWVILLTYIVKI